MNPKALSIADQFAHCQRVARTWLAAEDVHGGPRKAFVRSLMNALQRGATLNDSLCRTLWIENLKRSLES